MESAGGSTRVAILATRILLNASQINMACQPLPFFRQRPGQTTMLTGRSVSLSLRPHM